MTSALGATLPLQSAPPAVDGEVADPAASLPFLAALAAAVAAPVTPPPAPVVETPVTLAEALVSDEGEASAVDETSGSAEDSLVALARAEGRAVRSGPLHADAEETAASATTVDAGERAPNEAAARDDEGSGGRLRVLIADRAAPSAVEPNATKPLAAPTEPAPAGADAPDTDDDHELHGAAPLPLHRAESATPSWQAAMHALTATARATSHAPSPEIAPAPEAPLAVPASPMSGVGGERGRPSGTASSTAAGVLAAMHAAHLAQHDGESIAAPVARFAEQVVASLTPEPAALEASATDGEAGATPGLAAIADGAEPTPLPTPLRVVMTARSTASSGEQESAREQRDDAPSQERPTLAPVSRDAIEAPVSAGRAPWMTTEAATMPSAADVAKPAIEGHRTAEPRSAPPSPTSQVTVELDAEQTGAQRVRVAVRGDVVHATVVTDRGGVEAMRPQLDDLRHALEGQGFREAHVQLRVATDATSAVASGGTPELRLRNEAPSRAPDGSGAEQQPRGRQRGQDHQPPAGGQPDFEEDLQ